MMPIKARNARHVANIDYGTLLYPDPPSHDACVCLVIAELMRRYMAAPAPLKVRLMTYGGKLGYVDFSHYSIRDGHGYRCELPDGYSDQMIANVVRPAIEMIGAVEGPVIEVEHGIPYRELGNFVEYDYHIGHLVDAGRAGFEIPQFKAPDWAHLEVQKYLDPRPPPRRPVIITLRETPAQTERNSRIDEWLKFAESISDRYEVLFVRDTCKAQEALPGFRTWPRAAENVYVRSALYQRAFVNMFVGNGPSIWCIFSGAPYLIFKQLIPGSNWMHGHPQGWREQDHMEVGDQYPWATPLQRLAWEDDTFEGLTKTFEDFVLRTEERKINRMSVPLDMLAQPGRGAI